MVVSETPREEETKRELFETLRTKTLAKLNLRGRMGQPPRRSTVTLLTGLSETKEDLEKALEVIAAWRTVAMPPDSKTADDFIGMSASSWRCVLSDIHYLGRCIHLRHPEIALEVVVNRPKYGMDMPSLNTARRLLQGLSQAREGYNEEQILNECLALAEVYPVYGFPPATQDVVSCSILAKVLFRRIKDNRIRKDQGSEELTQAWCAIVAELKSAIKSWKAQAPSVSNTEERQLWADLEFIKGKLNHNNMSGDNGTWIREFQSKLHTSKRGV